MNITSLAITQTKSLSFIFPLVLFSFLTIGGCSENNGGLGAPAPAPQTMCTPLSNPCTSTTQNQDGTIFECTTLDGSACAVDLEDVIKQLDPNGTKLTGDTVMWIEAWGGAGGAARWGTGGAEGGYSVTTTTVADIKAKNGGSSTIFYFLGTGAIPPADRCGSGGGVATIVTTEDLVLNPNSNPTQSAPPILLVAGGGGGGAAGNNVGLCLTTSRNFPGAGGQAFATMQADGEGAGLGSTDGVGGNVFEFSMGGNLDGMGGGGVNFGDGPDGKPTPGSSGFGGLGGIGGTGPGCEGFGANNFSNTPVQLSITTGRGGNGGSARGSCAAGGGAGGGGYGGGGGGGSGNESTTVVGGAGGGSFAIQSTKFSGLAPTTKQAPCPANPSNGCVRITFAP